MSLDDRSFRHTAVHPPTLRRVAELAEELHLDLTDDELKQYKDAMSKTLKTSYQRLYDLIEPKLPVKYPRTPGCRPPRDENPLNAWSWKCNIPGASNGKLYGKTVAIKDNIPVAGVPMSNGSLILEGFIPDIDATVVTRVLDQGGRILGKATCENMCCGGSSFTSASGPVRNQLNDRMIAGGSSSGCAVLVGSGEVDMAIGGDQGGSIRMPAAACGIVGLKPTIGLVPYTGVPSMEFTLDHVGPMANTVFNTALLLEAIAGLDSDLDPRQPRDLKTKEYTKQLTGDIRGFRVGMVKEGFNPEFESDVNELVRKSAKQLISIGAVVEEVSIPWHSDGKHIFTGIFQEGKSRTIFDNVGCTGTTTYYDTNLQRATARGLKSHPNDQPPTVTISRLLGRYLQEDYYGIFYSKAQNLRRELKKAYDEALLKYDVLIMPTCPKKSSELPSEGITINEILHEAFQWNQNTSPFNVTGHPALSINAGFSAGLPVGMMIIGRHFEESTILNVAFAFERLRDKAQTECNTIY